MKSQVSDKALMPSVVLSYIPGELQLLPYPNILSEPKLRDLITEYYVPYPNLCVALDSYYLI